MSPAIRAQITAELGVEPVLINSALVSAQNRQRLYWAGKRNPDGTYRQVPVELPEDRGILLRDILETGFPLREKGYALQTGHGTTAEDAIARRQRNAVAEPVAIKPLTEKEMEYMVRETKDGRNHFGFDYFHDGTKDKSACVTANTHKGVPYNVLAEPVRIGTIENDAKNQAFDSQQYRVYSPDGKAVTLCGNGGGLGAKTGLYAVPISAENNKVILKAIDILADRKGYVPEMFNPYNRTEITGKAPTLSTGSMVTSSCAVLIFETADGKQIPVYEVRGGRITIKGKEYPVKLRDGLYIIRKLTVTECKRLQTVPDTYAFPVSDTQAYKMLGNGWTVDVIAHIMSHFTGLTEEPVEEKSVTQDDLCRLRSIHVGFISPSQLKRAKAEGKLDHLLAQRDEIEVPLDTGGTVTVVCCYVTPTSARFVFKDCWDEGVMNDEATNKTGYFKSKGRKHVLEDIYPHIAAEWREIIVPRTFVETIEGERVEYSDPLWLPSATDVFGTPDGAWWNDGDDDFQLPVFARERDRVKECGDKGTYFWWLRSVYAGRTAAFCSVATDGSADSNSAYSSYGFAPGFDI